MIEEVDGIIDASAVHAEQRETPMERRLFQERPKDDQEVQAQHEARNGHAHIGDQGGGHVEFGVLVGGGKDPERDPDCQRHEEGGAKQQDGVWQPLHEEGRNRSVVDERVPQIAMEEGAHVQHVLLGDRI